MKQILIFFCLCALALFFDMRPFLLDTVQSKTISVTVRGAVEKEGEVKLPVYSTVQDLLDETELKKNADLSSLNPQTILADQDVVSIPFAKEEEEVAKISINTASLEELCTLPGIGPSIAARIIAARQEGLFQTIEDLTKVKGIGEAKLARIRDLICL